MLSNLKKQIGHLVKASQTKPARSFSSDDEEGQMAESLLQRPPISLKASAPYLVNKAAPKVNEDVIRQLESSYKTAYTHGFEAIYSLENVDITTVRRIGQGSAAESPASYSLPTEAIEKKKVLLQTELDLGKPYRGWMPSWQLQEPIQVLKLSSQSEKALLEAGKRTIQDLRSLNEAELPFLKGMGQGHIDEMKQKLSYYLHGRDLDKCRILDATSLLRCLFSAEERLRVFAYLEPFGLSEEFPLTPSEAMTWRWLSEDKRHELASPLCEGLRKETQKSFVEQALGEVAEVFVKPWIRRRLGLATEAEIWERLERLSSRPAVTVKTFTLIAHTYSLSLSLPLASYLIEVEKGLFCADSHTALEYREMRDCIDSYFYAPSIEYEVSDLVQRISKELARGWRYFPDVFITKVLRLSSRYRCYNGLGRTLWITRL